MAERLLVQQAYQHREAAADPALLPFPGVPGNPCVRQWWDAVRDVARRDGQTADGRSELQSLALDVGAEKLAVRAPHHPADARRGRPVGVQRVQYSAALALAVPAAAHGTRAAARFAV